MELSDDQETVLFGLGQWRERPATDRDQYRVLGGYAGTGKSTLVSHVARTWDGVAAVALCGKAAHVLRSKGVDAQTIHSLIYYPVKVYSRTVFKRRPHLDGTQIIIVDEASMIDHVLMRDLLSYGIRVLFVGDHGQLEPIGSNPRIMANPDFRLEQIHRQAMGNPILRLAAAFREGREVPRLWNHSGGNLSIRSRSDFEGSIKPGIQVICGFNKTRHGLNTRVRELSGFQSKLPTPGERLICLQNHRHWHIFNGQQFQVLDVRGENKRTIELDVETDDGRSFTLPCLKEQFGRDQIKDFKDKEIALLDYGYAITAHKAQGSEWSEVLVLEEIHSQWDTGRWRYTVVTRAKERLVYCG